jgi:hypothetical protein
MNNASEINNLLHLVMVSGHDTSAKFPKEEKRSQFNKFFKNQTNPRFGWT